MADDPIEQLFVELSIQTDKFRKDVDDLLQGATQQIAKKAPTVPLKLDAAGFLKQSDKMFQDYQKTLQKSMGVFALKVDTTGTKKSIDDAVKLFLDQVPKLQKAGTLDLKVQTDNLKKSIAAAIQQTNQQISSSGAAGPGVEFAKRAGDQLAAGIVESLVPAQAATNTMQKQFGDLGKVTGATFQAMVTSFAQTRNPLIALTTGVEALHAGLIGMAAAGDTAAASLDALVAPIAAIVAIIAVVTALFTPLIGFIKQTGEEGQKMASQVQTQWLSIRVAANNLGVGFDVVNNKIQELEANGIKTTDALSASMVYLASQIPVDKLDQLTRAAQNMAVAFGQDPSQMVDLFTHAVTSLNTTVLKSVGIADTAAQMEQRYAQALHTVVADLTPAQKSLAVQNGILRDSAGYAGLYEKSIQSLGGQIALLPTYVQAGTLALGQTLMPFLQQSITNATRFWQTFQTLFVQMKQVKDAEGNISNIQLTQADGTPAFTKLGQQIYDSVTKITQATQPMVNAFMNSLPKIAGAFGTIMDKVTSLYGLISALGPIAGNVFGILTNYFQLIGQAINNVLNVPLWKSVTVTIGGTAVEVKNLGDAFGVMAQIALDSIGSVVGGFTLVTSQARNFFSVLTGHGAVGGWAQWVAQAKAAHDQVIAQLKDVASAASHATPAPGVDLGTGGGAVNQEAQNRLEQETAAAQQFIALQTQYGQQQVEAEHQLGVQMIQATVEWKRQQADAADQFTMQQLRAERDAGIERVHMERDFQIQLSRQLQDYDINVQRQTLQRNKEFARQQILDKQQFLLEMQRMDQDYGVSLEDAIRNRDARQVLNLMRQHKTDVSRKQEDFDLQQKLAKQQLDLQVQQDQIQRQYLIEDAQRNYARQQQDFEKNLADQRAAAKQSYADQLTDMGIAFAKAQTRRAADYQTQLTEMGYQHGIQMGLLVQQWADNQTISETGASQILGIMDKYYGANGKILGLVKDFSKRLKTNADILITVQNVVGPLTTGAGGATGATDSSGNPIVSDFHSQAAPAGTGKDTRTWVPPSHPHRALGGLDVVNKPTSILFGEQGGSEGILSFPTAGGHMSLGQLSSLLSGGSGGRKDRLDVALKISSDGTITPDIQNAIYADVAKLLAQTIGIRLTGS